jgi:gliding motility-associated-like protein
MTAGITVTAPTGFEVSTTAGSGFANSIVVGAAGTIASTTVYVRLIATNNVGSYSGNIVLTSSGASTVNVATVSSTVTQKALIITASNQTKCQGILFNIPTTAYLVSGLLNSDVVISVSLGSIGSATNATAGSYPIIPSSAIGTGLSNYSINYTNGIFTVNALPIVAAITGNQQVCIGSTTDFASTATGGVGVWGTSNAAIAKVSSSGTVSGLAAGSATINYTVTSSGGCVTVVSRTVTVNALPTVTVSASPTNVSKGLTTQLTAIGSIGTTYQWTPAGNLSDATIANPVARVTDNTTYIVTVTNTQGCTQSGSVNVTVTEDMYVDPVIVFTPNGDGINDKFVIKNLDQYPVNHLQVFDRTGKVVYETNNYSNNWDGTVNGKLLVKDSYFYVLTIKGAIIKRGSITLVR